MAALAASRRNPGERDREQAQGRGAHDEEQQVIDARPAGDARRGLAEEHERAEANPAARGSPDQVEEDRAGEREQAGDEKGCEEAHPPSSRPATAPAGAAPRPPLRRRTLLRAGAGRTRVEERKLERTVRGEAVVVDPEVRASSLDPRGVLAVTTEVLLADHLGVDVQVASGFKILED
jgi:hypothetical protein